MLSFLCSSRNDLVPQCQCWRSSCTQATAWWLYCLSHESQLLRQELRTEKDAVEKRIDVLAQEIASALADADHGDRAVVAQHSSSQHPPTLTEAPGHGTLSSPPAILLTARQATCTSSFLSGWVQMTRQNGLAWLRGVCMHCRRPGPHSGQDHKAGVAQGVQHPHPLPAHYRCEPVPQPPPCCSTWMLPATMLLQCHASMNGSSIPRVQHAAVTHASWRKYACLPF